MFNNFSKFLPKRTSKALLSFGMAMLFVFSFIPNVVFADTPMPLSRSVYISYLQINGGTLIASSSTSVDYMKVNNVANTLADTHFPATSLNDSVPVNSNFTLLIGGSGSSVLLASKCWDFTTGKLSASKINSNLIYIKDTDDGTIIPDSGLNLSIAAMTYPDGTSKPGTYPLNITSKTALKYGTNYQLVVQKGFDKINGGGTCMGGILTDVVINFKTVVQPKPTLTSAVLMPSNLNLTGLLPGQNFEYYLSNDGKFDDPTKWVPFTYTGDSASIPLSGVTLTANSKIEVKYIDGDGSTSANTSDPISVLYPSLNAPTFSGATVNGTNLVLNGLPNVPVGLECNIAPNGTNYNGWQDITVTNSSANIDATGLAITPSTKIMVRYKEDLPYPASDSTTGGISDYGLNTTAPLIQGTDTVFNEGIKINSVTLNTPGTGEVNTATVNHAEGQKLPVASGWTNMGIQGGDNVSDLPSIGSGVYKFHLAGAGSGDGNDVKITMPFQLPTTMPPGTIDPTDTKIDNTKVSIYVLSVFDTNPNEKEVWEYWKWLPTTINSDNTATVDMSGFDTTGKDVILSVRIDTMKPDGLNIEAHSNTDTSITLHASAGDESGISQMVVTRTNYADPTDIKTIILSYNSYPDLANAHMCQTDFVDDTPVYGVKYCYTLTSVTDMLGNKTEWPGISYNATTDSIQNMVNDTKTSILASVTNGKTDWGPASIQFAQGDNQGSVTQNLQLPTKGIFSYHDGGITWTSSNTDIVKIDRGLTEIHPPVDANGNPTEATVNLTGTITYKYGVTTNGAFSWVTATGTVVVPITVKWSIANKAVTIGSQFNHVGNLSYLNLNIDPTIDINTAANISNNVADTIVLQHSVIWKAKANYVFNSDGSIQNGTTYSPQDYFIDAHGKTIRADFDGALFNSNQNSGSFTLENAVIDMNHKSGPILSSKNQFSNITFKNVKIINADNCKYGVMLEATPLTPSSFTAVNCQFPSFKVAAIVADTSEYSNSYFDSQWNVTRTTYYNPVSVNISGCTFDGEGNPGYGVLDAFGNVSITNSTFKNYTGSVATGWTTSNDTYSLPIFLNGGDELDGDGNDHLLYKGVPDGSPSAAVLAKEKGILNLSDNIITNCANSALIWTGETSFSFLGVTPPSGYVANTTVNGTIVTSTTATQVKDNILSSNTIYGTSGGSSNNVVIQDAADRYNRTNLQAGVTIPNILAPNVTADDTANKIVGIDNGMEYSLDGGSHWIKYTIDPDLSGNCTVEVRIAEDVATGAPTGAITTLYFTTNLVPVTPSAPAVTVDDVNNTIKGIDTTMEFKVDSATGYTKFNGSNLPGLGGAHTVLVRVASAGINPAGPATILAFTVTPTVAKDSTSTNYKVDINESDIQKDGANIIKPSVPSTATSFSTSIDLASIIGGTGTERIQATLGGNDITLSLPFDAVDFSSSNNSTAQFVLSQSVSTDSTATNMLANAPTADKTIGKVFSFNLEVAGTPVHNFANGKTASISIKLTADDIKGLDTSKLSAFYYDETSGKWIQVGGSFDPSTMIFTFNTSHFTTFTVMQTSTASTISSPLPQTGSTLDLYTLMFIGVSFLGAGVFLTVKKWRRNIQ